MRIPLDSVAEHVRGEVLRVGDVKSEIGAIGATVPILFEEPDRGVGGDRLLHCRDRLAASGDVVFQALQLSLQQRTAGDWGLLSFVQPQGRKSLA